MTDRAYGSNRCSHEIHFRPRTMSIRSRLLVTGAIIAASSFAPVVTHAQAAPAAPATAPDSIAFPRQFVKWVFAAQGDSAYAHAGPELQASMKSAAEAGAMAGRIKERFGDLQGTEAEVQFDEGSLKVYIAAVRLSQAPELAGWVVVYSPTTKIVERSAFSSLTNIKARYPQAKLP